MADRYVDAAPANGHRSTSEIVQDIVDNIQEIVRSELQLAKVELTDKGKRIGSAAGVFAAGAAVAAVAGLMIVAVATAALALVMPVWLACLIVAVLLGMAGGGMLIVGRQRLRQTSVVPEKTISGLKEDVAWLKHPTK